MVELHPSTYLQAAAWVPDDDPERPWEDAADLAADWIWERSKIEGVAPLLVTNTVQNGVGIGCLDEIARRGGRATPQGKQRFDRGPVLAYVPDERTLKFALDLARGYSLAVVETVSFPLAEWAAGAGAINLLDGSTSTSSIPDDVKADLDRAVFFGGNNGWTGPDEKQHARAHLGHHVQSGRLAPEQAASYVMSQGVSDRGAKRLRLLLEKLA
ncbi:hypothetical protein GCM10027280_60710 [Micromonospora polyrhachis]|uniref:Uncharacterized protein n=1 Tax=Micromonospora polyrhachis TaxID=1282883 RepID=A0A7W7WQG4_9ACTN|nr:hypothetical protein [Micromonospora polyrhachis]MBB4960256.1 hypothetical protein [Micromonospora polyrhachis]